MLQNSIHAAFAKASANFCLEIFEGLDESFDELVQEALDQTGKRHRRNCPLKAPLMVYFTILLALNRVGSMANVFNILVDKVRQCDHRLPLKPVTCNALLAPQP